MRWPGPFANSITQLLIGLLRSRCGRVWYSLFVSSFSSCGFHFSPFHGCSHFLLFIPDPSTPIKSPVPSPDCVVKFGDSFFSEYTASERHSRDLNEYLELNREAAIDRMEWLEE
jgi:hypothetical protein